MEGDLLTLMTLVKVSTYISNKFTSLTNAPFLHRVQLMQFAGTAVKQNMYIEYSYIYIYNYIYVYVYMYGLMV